MTKAERSIERASKAARQIESLAKYAGYSLVWLGEHGRGVNVFRAVKDGNERTITAYMPGNVIRMVEMF